MDSLHADTIVAPITGTGPSAVAVLRLSGPDSFAVASKVFTPWPDPVENRYALVGRFRFGETGIALPFRKGASFTGEQTVELSVHGGAASVKALLDSCIRFGARMALPGEFTLRAFLNGKLDLSQAEAISDLVEAQTEKQLRLANLNLKGELRSLVQAVMDRILAEVAKLEASIDFSEDIGEFDFVAATSDYAAIAESLREILTRGKHAHLSRRGIRIALVGPPNAGKSSLFNRILGLDRAIVTSIAGTTRDTLEESMDWRGTKVVLIDTAGIREVDEQIERLGIERTHDAAKSSDMVLYIYDSSHGWTSEDDLNLSKLPPGAIVVASKADLASVPVGLTVSSLTGQGLDELYEVIVQDFGPSEDFAPTNERQSVHIESALNSMWDALSAVQHNQPPDLISVLLNEALDSLGKVLGTTASPDMLSEIFSRFCIGK